MDANHDHLDELIDTALAAAFVGLSPRTLELKRQTGDGPRYVRVSARCIRYRRRDLKEWAESRLRSNTADHGPDSRQRQDGCRT